MAYFLSFTLFFPLTSKMTFASGLVKWRHALVSTRFHPSTPTSRDWTRPRLRKSTPDWGGWLRRLREMKLGQADSRQAESGRSSRVVQAFSARSSPLETTLKPVVASPLRRHFTLETYTHSEAKFRPRWDHPVKPSGHKEDPARKKTRLGEYKVKVYQKVDYFFLLVCNFNFWYYVCYRIIEECFANW